MRSSAGMSNHHTRVYDCSPFATREAATETSRTSAAPSSVVESVTCSMLLSTSFALWAGFSTLPLDGSSTQGRYDFPDTETLRSRSFTMGDSPRACTFAPVGSFHTSMTRAATAPLGTVIRIGWVAPCATLPRE